VIGSSSYKTLPPPRQLPPSLPAAQWMTAVPRRPTPNPSALREWDRGARLASNDDGRRRGRAATKSTTSWITRRKTSANQTNVGCRIKAEGRRRRMEMRRRTGSGRSERVEEGVGLKAGRLRLGQDFQRNGAHLCSLSLPHQLQSLLHGLQLLKLVLLTSELQTTAPALLSPLPLNKHPQVSPTAPMLAL